MKNIKTLKIVGKKWFQKSFGNTYHSVTIYVNDEKIYQGFTYGYGNQYLQTAFEMLLNADYNIPNEYNAFIKFLYNNNFSYNAINVNRKKDL